MKKSIVFFIAIFTVPMIVLAATMMHKDVPITLYGIVSEHPKPQFTAEGLFDGSFQGGLEEWYKDAHPCRALFVKIYNQMMYCLDSCLFSGDIVVGKDGWLYSKEYISCSFEGISEDAQKTYDEYAKKVKRLQDNLEASGKKFIYVISPSKVEMYPEFLPGRFQMIQKNRNRITNNYDYLLERLKAESVNCVDAEKVLQNAAGEIPFFAKTGIHWNYYAAALCAEEIIKNLDACRDIHVEAVQKDTPFGAEQDIYGLSNIFKGTVDREYYGGKLVRGSSADLPLQNVLEMGTSFSVELAGIFCTEGSFMWEQMVRYQYFVSRTIYRNGMPAEGQAGEDICREQMKGELEEADIVLMENNASYIPESHFEFVDEALRILEAEMSRSSG